MNSIRRPATLPVASSRLWVGGSRSVRTLLLSALAATLAILGLMPAAAQLPNTFANTGSLAAARVVHTATLLPNGKVLVAGGSGNSGFFASAELYDPASGTWTATGSLAAARQTHTATLLPNGKVLVTGGLNGSNLTSAELYDPASGTWTTTGSLAAARYRHTATLLPSGKVLVAGGTGNSGYLASAELYDPASGTWAATGSLATARYLHTATLLPNGKVLVAGGQADGAYLASAELYDAGLAFAASWQSAITAASFNTSGRLVLSGTGFNGISGASGGNTQDSSTNYPVVQLRRLDNDQVAFLLPDPAAGFSTTAFTSAAGASDRPGIALVTVFTNGIPSPAVLVQTADQVAPVVTAPANLTVPATAPSGATVSFTPTATDAVGVVSLVSSPASGSVFPVGTTAVTVTATDAANNTGTATFTVTVTPLSPVQSWRYANFGTTANSGSTADGADYDGDGLVNLHEFAFGVDPKSNLTGALQYGGTFASGTLLAAGTPTTRWEGGDVRGLFIERMDYLAAGLTYTAQFSSNLTAWENGTVTPTVLASNGTVRIVSVPFPVLGSGVPANFFRVVVNIAP